jgi:hypothetical protein
MFLALMLCGSVQTIDTNSMGTCGRNLCTGCNTKRPVSYNGMIGWGKRLARRRERVRRGKGRRRGRERG